MIATKTKLDIGGLEVPEHINDDYFKKVTKQSDKSKDGIFASGEKEVILKFHENNTVDSVQKFTFRLCNYSFYFVCPKRDCSFNN